MPVFTKTSLIALVLASCAHQALACSAEPLIGATCFTAATFCPRGYLEANGQTLPVQNNVALYSLIKRLYTAPTLPQTQFSLPDLRGRSPVSAGVTGSGILTQGTARGAETAILTVDQMPLHTHTATPSSFSLSATSVAGASVTPSPGVNQLARSNLPAAKIYAAPGGTVVPLGGVNNSTSVVVNNAGNGTPVKTLSPQIVLRACIATTGIFPTHP